MFATRLTGISHPTSGHFSHCFQESNQARLLTPVLAALHHVVPDTKLHNRVTVQKSMRIVQYQVDTFLQPSVTRNKSLMSREPITRARRSTILTRRFRRCVLFTHSPNSFCVLPGLHGTLSTISRIPHPSASQILTRMDVFTSSPLESFASVVVDIPAARRICVRVIPRSISNFQSRL